MLAFPIALLGAIGLGGVAVSARGAMRGAHLVAVVGVSMALAVAVTVIVALVFASGNIGYGPVAVLPWIAALGVVHFIGGRSLGMVAVNIVGASCTSLFIAAQEPFPAFFAIALTGETLRPLVVVGAIAVVIALVPATGDSPTQGWRTDRRYLFGYLVGLVSGASMGAGAVLAKQSIGIYDSPPRDNLPQHAGGPDHPPASLGRRGPRHRRQGVRPQVHGFHRPAQPEHRADHHLPVLRRAASRCRDRGSPAGRITAVDAAAFPPFHRLPRSDSPAPGHRRSPRGDGRDSRVPRRPAVATGITSDPSLRHWDGIFSSLAAAQR